MKIITAPSGNRPPSNLNNLFDRKFEIEAELHRLRNVPPKEVNGNIIRLQYNLNEELKRTRRAIDIQETVNNSDFFNRQWIDSGLVVKEDTKIVGFNKN